MSYGHASKIIEASKPPTGHIPAPIDPALWSRPDLQPALTGHDIIAETFAVTSMRRWDGGRQRSRTMTGVVLATIHVKAGERRGLRLAHTAITDVTTLTSVRVRRQLIPLAEALEARPGSDARELARMARQVAV